MAATLTPTQKAINKATGVNRGKVNTKSRIKGIKNIYRRKSNGGQGG